MPWKVGVNMSGEASVTKILWPKMMPIEGVRIGVADADIKQNNRNDLTLFAIDEGSTVSGVFTQNAFCAAPVVLGRSHLAKGSIRCFVINSGNANACTGEQGLSDALSTCQKAASLMGLEARQVIPFSTGVIGEPLPTQKLLSALPNAQSALVSDGWRVAAEAIMTTDTQPKGASVQFEFDGELISVTGIAKGAGMIRPNMATMLAFIATDAVVCQAVLDDLAKYAADQSFNRVSIDGDTSTNDACMLVATGRVGLPMIAESSGELYGQLRQAVVEVMQSLAQDIVKDGEGATKFVTIDVVGGSTRSECLQVAYSVAHSPLVKTALYASDANWGRIVAAIGYAGVPELDASGVKVWLDEVLIVEDGGRAASYTEALGAAVVSLPSFTIKIDLGRGHAEDRVWTSDLSHDYVTINAEYRT